MPNQNIPGLNKIIFEGKCLNNKDKTGAGRIRASYLAENEGNREESIEFTEWDEKDPFIFRPLLPWFINQVPEPGESVLLFYSNLAQKGTKNKFYIGGIFSSPTKVKNEPVDDSNEISDMGDRNKPSLPLYGDDGVPVSPNIEGVWSLPSDISIDGRGNSDIVVKKNSVDIRAGKTTTDLKPNVLPIKNDERAFLQLTQYNKKTFFPSGEKRYTIQYDKETPIKKLIEYVVTNPENTQNAYRGHIFVYNINPNIENGQLIKAINFDINTNIETTSAKGTPVVQIDFSSFSEQEIVNLMNDTLKQIIKGDLNPINQNYNVTMTTGLEDYKIDENDKYPFYFRPQPSFNRIVSPDNTTNTTQERLFVGRLMAQIKAVSSDLTGGYGLVYDVEGEKIKQSVPFTPKKQIVIPRVSENIRNTAGIMGADVLYLLSHQSQKKSTGKINLKDTLAGITETKLTDEIEPKTSSMVRGEELMELLNIIVKFLLNHVHGYHGLPPDAESIDGVKKDKLFEELQNAEKILNKYIRIN